MSQSLVGVDTAMTNATYVYYLTKQVLAVYESTINYLPLQVYNEFRNAIDHYFRSLTNFSYDKDLTEEEAWSNREAQLKKLNGHVVRAFLDMVKITNEIIAVEIKQKHKDFGLKALELVNNGKYIPKMEVLLDKAQDDFLKAKQSESVNGAESMTTIDLFLDSFSSHLNARSFCIASKKHFYKGVWKYRSIKGTTLGGGIIIGIIVAIVGRFIWGVMSGTPKIQTWQQDLSHILQAILGN